MLLFKFAIERFGPLIQHNKNGDLFKSNNK